jgi:hypothetical protein
MERFQLAGKNESIIQAPDKETDVQTDRQPIHRLTVREILFVNEPLQNIVKAFNC